MALLDIFGKKETKVIEVVRVSDVQNVKQRSKRSASDFTSEIQIFRSQEDIATLELAIEDSQNLETHDREALHRIYRRVIEDTHLSSQFETRKLKTLEKQYSIFPKGSEEPDEEKTKIMRKGWVREFINQALNSRAWGFMLIELNNWDYEKKCFMPYISGKSKRYREAVHVVNHDHVKPEFGIITRNSSDTVGKSFFDPRFSRSIVFVGGIDHGFLYDISKPTLIKDNALLNWSEWAEKFGHDMVVGTTEAEGSAKKRFLNMLKNLGSSGYGTKEPDDEIDFMGTSRTDAFNVYDKLIDKVDAYQAKKVFGQDVVSNNTGQVVGTTGENIAELYGRADMMFIETLINDNLLPLLTANGCSMEGYEFRYLVKEKISLKERSEVDLNITNMGFLHDPDYINETYGTRVEEKQTAPTSEVINQIKATYENKKKPSKRES